MCRKPMPLLCVLSNSTTTDLALLHRHQSFSQHQFNFSYQQITRSYTTFPHLINSSHVQNLLISWISQKYTITSRVTLLIQRQTGVCQNGTFHRHRKTAVFQQNRNHNELHNSLYTTKWWGRTPSTCLAAAATAIFVHLIVLQQIYTQRNYRWR